MELRHLNAFLAVAEELHFGRAAERLGMSQPPLSRQIQILEADLGVKLFSRTSRSVKLTAEGVAYQTAVRPHLQGLLDAAKAARSSSRKLSGKIKAGFVSCMAYFFVPKVAALLEKNAPGIAVEWIELPSPEQQRALRERRIDIGLILLPASDPALKLRTLYREPLVAMLPTDHRFASLPEIPVNALADEKFVMCPRYRVTGFHETIFDFCRSAGFEPQVHQEASSKTAITELVASHFGISLVPQSGSLDDHPGVTYRRLASPPFILETASVWLEESMNPLQRSFLDQMIDAASEMKEMKPFLQKQSAAKKRGDSVSTAGRHA